MSDEKGSPKDPTETENELLRTERTQYPDQILTILGFSFATTVSIVGWGLGKPGWPSALIPLLPLLIQFAAMALVLSARQNDMRIATYLRQFGGKSFRYETRLADWRERASRRIKDGAFNWHRYDRALYFMFFWQGLVCLLASLIAVVNHWPDRFAIASLVAVILIAGYWMWKIKSLYSEFIQNKMSGTIKPRVDEAKPRELHCFELWEEVAKTEKEKDSRAL